MHKIKEMLHKDSEDKTYNNHSSSSESGGLKETIKEKLHMDRDSSAPSSYSSMDNAHTHAHEHDSHAHSHERKSSLGKAKDLKEEVKEKIHKDKSHKHMHEHDHLHEHSHDHAHLGAEKHVYHERKHIEGSDLYREGVDPTFERDIKVVERHDGGVVREKIGEGKIVKETIKEVELHKVQPVIHREREQKEIRHVVEPHHKFEVKDTKIHHRERDIDLGVRREASTLETSRSLGHAPHIESSREILGKERQHQELPAKVEEHVHRKIEEHVHPVIYKEVLKPKVTEETHHIYEKIKEAPVETYEVKEIDRSRDLSCLSQAEREFFARESSRGITISEGHQHVHSHDHAHAHSHDHAHAHSHEHSHKLKEGKMKDKIKDKSLKSKDKIKDKSHKAHKHSSHEHSHAHSHADPKIIPVHTHAHAHEPLIGHHQNIGGHHLAAGAVPPGHNVAYDNALYNTSSQNLNTSSAGLGPHSARDEALMQKMEEKKIVQDQKLAGEGKFHSTVV